MIQQQKSWSRMHVDFTGSFMSQMIFLLVDVYSKCYEDILIDTSTSVARIIKLHDIFAIHGLPETLVTDNEKNFSSEEFSDFLLKNGVKHFFTAPYHPVSNGLAKTAVQVVKEALKKKKKEI